MRKTKEERVNLMSKRINRMSIRKIYRLLYLITNKLNLKIQDFFLNKYFNLENPY